MCQAEMRLAESKEGEVGEGPTILRMAGGSPFNELLLWPSSTSQLRCVKLRCVLLEDAESEEGEVGEGPTILWIAGGSPFSELLLWPSSTSQLRYAGLG